MGSSFELIYQPIESATSQYIGGYWPRNDIQFKLLDTVVARVKK